VIAAIIGSNCWAAATRVRRAMNSDSPSWLSCAFWGAGCASSASATETPSGDQVASTSSVIKARILSRKRMGTGRAACAPIDSGGTCDAARQLRAVRRARLTGIGRAAAKK
jgi:hypothetical protein